jgi:KipI family sensor histidine kinase inhibitor
MVRVADVVAPEVNGALRELMLLLEESDAGIVELIPAYTTLLVLYDPLAVSYEETLQEIEDSWNRRGSVEQLPAALRYELPTVYGGEYGPDLERVCEHAGLSAEAVIKLHARRDYLIYFIGFSPGYPYLGGLPEELATPRRDTPRTRIPPGSVGIGGSQTGLYPQATPGGWNLIGRTPVSVYDPRKDPPTPYTAGDYIRFVPISANEFEELAEKDDRGQLELEGEVVSDV